jgi:hypothetical protein
MRPRWIVATENAGNLIRAHANGEEMNEVFRPQTAEAIRTGNGALLRVLARAMLELSTCAIPSRACSTAAIACAGSIVSTSMLFGCLLWALHNPVPLKNMCENLERATVGTVRIGGRLGRPPASKTIE